jgi:hypothetical protein
VNFGEAAEILRSVNAERGNASMPLQLCEAARSAVPVTGVGLGLMTQAGHAGMVAATNGPAITMERLQFTLGEGPCLDASRSGRPVLKPDIAAVPVSTWPGFLTGLSGSGVQAIFAFPLRVGGIRIGVLDFYRDRVGPLTNDELKTALTYSDAATLLLLRLQALSSAGELHPSLQEPWEHRAVVHQATGMISAQAGASIADAFRLLAAGALAAERPIGGLARDVVERRLRVDDDPDGTGGFTTGSENPEDGNENGASSDRSADDGDDSP